MILGNFSRRKIFGYRIMIATTLLIGFLGILVWGHHMFVAGLNPFAGTAFSISTMAIAIPAAAKVLSWLATIWRSRPEYKTPMLFALGFVSLFVTGGLTGPILAQPILDQYLHNTFFVVAHFHFIMAMAGVFGLFAATYYYFPLVTGRFLSEPLGRVHFWGTFLGAYATFLPMHITGLAGEPRHYAQLTGLPGTAAARLLATGSVPLQGHITWSAIFLASVQIVFLFNLVRSFRAGQPAPQNPWQATTLEWHPDLAPFPAHLASNQPFPVYRAPCAYGDTSFQTQWDSGANPE
jgi:cytochrome c oxidase subunit 1